MRRTPPDPSRVYGDPAETHSLPFALPLDEMIDYPPSQWQIMPYVGAGGFSLDSRGRYACWRALKRRKRDGLPS